MNKGLFTFVNMNNNQAAYIDFTNKYSQFKFPELQGRYVTYDHLKKFLARSKEVFQVEEIGRSTKGTPIHSLSFGKGEIKILAWSQMHGNESTTTKAVVDSLNAFRMFQDDPLVNCLRDNITLQIIPLLNPDGAKVYSRVNANQVDLNRDARLLKEVESKILRAQFDLFQPDFCFNLHDQRTIFSAGNQPFPATISFLTPAMNEEQEIFPSRESSMKVIACIAEDLKKIIPNQIGRYDDAYNINCTGDSFQTMEVPTILIEAGHYQQDYSRDKTREFVGKAILSGLHVIATGSWKNRDIQEYFNIPQNQKLYFDVILRNCRIKGQTVDLAIQYKEHLAGKKIKFLPVIGKIGFQLAFYGHREVNCNGEEIKTVNNDELHENVIVNKLLLKNEVLIII